MNLNHTTLAGNLTRDPELRTISAERAVAHFTLANSRRFKTADGEAKEETLFLDCEAWGRSGELVAQYLTKGSPVVVEGRLRLDQWTDKDGGKRSRVKLVVEAVHFVGTRANGPAGNGAAGQPATGDDSGIEDRARGPAPARTGTSTRPSNRVREAAASDDQPPF